jgi:micrococcal nuclease
VQATEANRRLVEGKIVRLEYDVQSHDRYGRLLAYVYLGDQMVNDLLVSEGFATQLTVPPNVKYAKQFEWRVREARAAKRGLWADPPPAKTGASKPK